MSYTREELSQLKRKELQKLCKQTGGSVKANKKTCELVNDLAEYFEKEENEMKEMEAEMKMYDAVDLNATWTVDNASANDKENESKHKENESDRLLKETLMEEVERRAEEKLSKIPRFVADKVIIPPAVEDSVAVAQATPEATKKQKSHGLKRIDSIDVYLAKKQKRAEDQLNFNEKNKENKRLKTSKSVSSLPQLSESRRKSVKIDNEISINFASKVTSKSVSSLPQLSESRRKSVKIDNEISINFAPKVESTPNPLKRVSPRTRVSSINNGRRSIIKSGQKEGNNGTDGRRFTLGCISSPASSKLQTPKAKSPVKFDIKASLKKPLAYKPHTGKLKQVYFNIENNTSLPRKPVASQVKTAGKKASVKEMNKNVSTRERRRKDAADKRSKDRLVVLDKRRGITG